MAKILRDSFHWMVFPLVYTERGCKDTLMNFIIPHVDKGLYVSSTGIDDITRNAPAMILFHG